MKIKDLIRYIPQSLPWLAVVAMGIVLLCQHTDLLYRAQEQSLFLPTDNFYSTSTAVPGGYLTYAAAFLTQFFYYPVLGIVMLVAMWALSLLLLKEGMKLNGSKAVLLTLLPVSLFSVIAQTGYSLFEVKLQGFFVVPSLAVFIISILVYKTSVLRGYWQSALIILSALAAYPIMGAYGLLAPIVMSLSSQKKLINIAFAIVSSFIACMVYYYTHATVMMGQLVYAALPSLYIGLAWRSIYAIPYIGILLGLLIPVLVNMLETSKVKIVLPYLIVISSVGVFVKCNYHNNNFRRELQMSKAIYEGDWLGVLNIVDESKKQFNPTRQIAFARNLALWRVGRLGDLSFSYTNETQKSVAPYDLSMPQICAAQQYYYSGMPYLAYRWTMETVVSYGWDVEGLKNFVRCSITVGEYQLALKYLNLLRQTIFHKDWAEYYYSLIMNPSKIKEDKDIAWVRSLLHYSNSLEVENGTTSENIYNYYAKCETNDSKIQEFGMIAAMINRDYANFKARFIQYISLNRDIVDVPKHYQEAALFMASLNNDEEIMNQPYSEEVLRQFHQFRKAYQNTENLPREQQSALLCGQFGHTYYYYYTSNRGIL